VTVQLYMSSNADSLSKFNLRLEGAV